MASELAAILDTVFKAGELIVLVGGGGVAIFKLGRALGSMTERMEAALLTQNQLLARQSEELHELKEEAKNQNREVIGVLQQIALQKKDIEFLNQRYEDLRRGEGFIFPFPTPKGASPS